MFRLQLVDTTELGDAIAALHIAEPQFLRQMRFLSSLRWRTFAVLSVSTSLTMDSSHPCSSTAALFICSSSSAPTSLTTDYSWLSIRLLRLSPPPTSAYNNSARTSTIFVSAERCSSIVIVHAQCLYRRRVCRLVYWLFRLGERDGE